MRTFILLLLYQVVSASAVTHSLQYFYTGSSGLHNFPEFLAVGVVDEVPIIYYDSIIQKAVSKQHWMNKVTEDDPQYWERESMGMIGTQQVFKSNIEIAKQRFNQTGGIHVVQLMYGCEWDDDTGEVRGYHQYGYDGKDFIAFDLKTETWIVPVLQAAITKNKWDHDVGWNKMIINYLTQECAHWLKKYVDYGRENLMRTVFPSVSLLQKTPSSPISCHATGFYPNRAEMFWRKDGVEIHEGVVKGEILPNDDGTFQMSANLEISSVIPEDWDRYDCVFQLSGLNEDIVIKLDKAVIKLNAGQSIIPVTVVVCVLMLQIIAVTFFIALYKRKTGSQISSASSHKKSITTTKPPIRNRKNSMDMGINLCCTELVSKCFCCPTDGDMVYYNHNITGYHTITITA